MNAYRNWELLHSAWDGTALSEEHDEDYGREVERDGDKVRITGFVRGEEIAVVACICGRCGTRCDDSLAIDPDGACIPLCAACAEWMDAAPAASEAA